MNAIPARPRRAVFLSALLQAVGGGLGWSLLPPLMPTIAKDLAITHALGGLVWGMAPLGIALASPFGGAAVDRHGPRRVAGLAMLAGALACGARAFVTGPYTLAAAMFLFGLHIGFVAPSLPKALAGHLPLGKLARANGLTVLAYTLGTAVTVLTARTVLAPAFGGWRTLMLAAAGAMAIAGVLWLWLMDDRTAVSKHAGALDALRLAKNFQLLRVASMHFLLFGGYLAMLGFLPRALGEAGLAPSAVGAAVAAWLVAAGIANFGGPWLSDRIAMRRPVMIGGALVAGLALGAFALLPHQSWLLIVAALGGGSFAPLLLTAPLELPGVGPARAGAAIGLLMLVGQAGGFLLPIATGAAAGSGGLPVALGVLALVHLAILVPALGLTETGSGTLGAAARSFRRTLA